MRKMIIIMGVVAATVSCGSNETKTASGGDKPATNDKASDLSANPDYKKGLALVQTSDCLTCHKIDDNSTGPAYTAIAKKYAGQPGIEDSLSDKIIKGGSGVWGSAPMNAHPQLSKEDAKAMAKYVLLLNQQ